MLVRGKSFCVCGDFREDIDECQQIRQQLTRAIIENGGVVENVIVPNLDYLVAGGIGELSSKRQGQLKACVKVTKISENELMAMIRPPPPPAAIVIAPLQPPPTIVAPMPVRRLLATSMVEDDIPSPPPDEIPTSNLLTDKYAPRELKDIVGNAKAVRTVCEYFESWKNGTRDKKQKRAILLCGKAGIGKSTLAAVAARHYGYEALEFNASDTRNKEEIRKNIYSATSTFSIRKGTNSKCVIMDEVDGMSLGDQGGAAELCKAIKCTRTPIVCICNDKYANSVKTLKLHCEVVDVWPPSQSECVSRLKYVAREERIGVDDVVLKKVAQECNGDMRHCLVTLGMLGVKRGNIFGDMAIVDGNVTDQDVSPFVAIRTVLGGNDTTLQKRATAYEGCSDMMSAFVAENYVHAGGNNLANIARAAESIVFGDMIESAIHKHQQWSLLPVQTYAAGAIPGARVKHGIGGTKIAFPAALGAYSKAAAMKRRARDNERQFGVMSDEIKYVVSILFERLCVEDAKDQSQVEAAMTRVPTVIETMQHYGMKREDLDALFEFVGKEERLKEIPPKVKRAITDRLARETKNGYADDTVADHIAAARRQRQTPPEDEEFDK